VCLEHTFRRVVRVVVVNSFCRREGFALVDLSPIECPLFVKRPNDDLNALSKYIGFWIVTSFKDGTLCDMKVK
jgi:hypothetical protein